MARALAPSWKCLEMEPVALSSGGKEAVIYPPELGGNAVGWAVVPVMSEAGNKMNKNG